MKKGIPILLLVLLSFSVPSGEAGAAAVLALSDGKMTMYVEDGSLSDLNPLTGAITFSGPVGGLIFDVTTGITEPNSGLNTAPTLYLSSVNVTYTSGGCGWLGFSLYDSEFPDSGTEEIVQSVPEPGTMILLGSGLVGMIWYRRMKRMM